MGSSTKVKAAKRAVRFVVGAAFLLGLVVMIIGIPVVYGLQEGDWSMAAMLWSILGGAAIIVWAASDD